MSLVLWCEAPIVDRQSTAGRFPVREDSTHSAQALHIERSDHFTSATGRRVLACYEFGDCLMDSFLELVRRNSRLTDLDDLPIDLHMMARIRPTKGYYGRYDAGKAADYSSNGSPYRDRHDSDSTTQLPTTTSVPA